MSSRRADRRRPQDRPDDDRARRDEPDLPVERPVRALPPAGRSRGSRPFPPRRHDRSGPSRLPRSKLPTSSTSSPASNDLRWDFPSLGVMAQQDVCGLVSFTAEGFLNILELSWIKMTRIDTRISRQLPYPVYVHCMNQCLLTQILRISDVTRQQATWHHRIQGEDAFHLIGGHQVAMPAEIYDWIQGLGSRTDAGGYPYNISVPELIIPFQRRVLQQAQMTGSDFGPVKLMHKATTCTIL